MSGQCTERRFLKDVAQHQMTVLRDEGVNRYVRFSKPDSSNMRFDLITWPGYLCYCGDMGTYVFSRTEDMFGFFRMDKDDWNYNKAGISINPGYWGEKLQAISCFGEGFEVFSMEKFTKAVNEYVEAYISDEGLPDGSESEAQALREAVESEVLSCEKNAYAAQDAAARFNHEGFEFTDFWERDFTEFSFHFLWCCYALSWGVQQYDKAKAESAVTA